MNKLKGSVCYLSGSMEFCPQGGVEWRRKFKSLINEHFCLGVKFIDPTDKPKELTQEITGCGNSFKQNNNWQGFVDYMKVIRHEDCRCVDLSDFVVVKIDKKIHHCGTYQEVFLAESQSKPILAIVDGGRWNLPGWVAPVFQECEIFPDEESCAEYLYKVNQENKLDPRWVLMRNYLK